MGDVDVTSIPPIAVDQVSNVEPLRISKIAPAAVHVKELNHIAPISVDSLRIDEVKNLDPVKVDRFDVTYLPTVNLSLGEAPELDVNLRQIPPLALGLHQDFVLPSEYLLRARLLGFEFLRVQVTGRTVMRPRDRVPREVSATHDRSYRQVAPVGNPAIPVTCREEASEAVGQRRRAGRVPAPARGNRPRPRHPGPGGALRIGGPPPGFALGTRERDDAESAVSSG